MSKEIVLEVKNLVKYFPYEKSFLGKVKSNLQAVDDVSFELYKGETLAIVGESGCGKSTLAKTIVRLNEKTKGSVQICGKDIYSKNKREIKEIRKDIQMIFQDPYSSLDPSMKIKSIIAEGILNNGLGDKENIDEKVIEALRISGLEEDVLEKYPREFSGGQRQRIGIARAISLNPKIIIADEPVSALDVSMQAQVVNLMIKLQRELNMSYIFISHDLSLVKYISTRVAVMYLGSIVEIGEKGEIYKNPKHPYTKALMEAIPINNPRLRGKKRVLEGDVPSAVNPPKGCKFSTRCPYVKEICKKDRPQLKEIKDGHKVACHFDL